MRLDAALKRSNLAVQNNMKLIHGGGLLPLASLPTFPTSDIAAQLPASPGELEPLTTGQQLMDPGLLATGQQPTGPGSLAVSLQLTGPDLRLPTKHLMKE